MRELMCVRRAWLWASLSMACVEAFTQSANQCPRNDLTVLYGEDWSKFMSVSDGAAQNTGVPDPFERMKKRPPRSMGGNTGMNYDASYPEAPNTGNYGPLNSNSYPQEDDMSSSYGQQSSSYGEMSSYGQSGPQSPGRNPNRYPQEDQTSSTWSSFMTVADGPEPIPDPVTRQRQEEMARKREEEQRMWQQQQPPPQQGQQPWQQQQQQQQSGGQSQRQGQQSLQQPYPQSGMQVFPNPYGPPFDPYNMQQQTPYIDNMKGRATPFRPSPFEVPFGAAAMNNARNTGYDDRGRPTAGDPYQEQMEEDRQQSENERARAIVQARMAAEMAKFEREQEDNMPSTSASSDTSPEAWWESLQAEQEAKDKKSDAASDKKKDGNKRDESRKWSATLPKPSPTGGGGYNTPWRPQSQMRPMMPPPPPPPPLMMFPPDANNAWTPDSELPPDRAPGYWSEFMAVSDGPASPKTYEEQKAEWERAQRNLQREQQEKAQKEQPRNPGQVAREQADRLREQVEQQQAEERAQWEKERLLDMEAEVREREMERKRSQMSVDNDDEQDAEKERDRARKRLEHAERMAQALVEQEMERAAAVARYRDLRSQVEAERQFRAEEEARARARASIEEDDEEDDFDEDEMDAIDVDIEEEEDEEDDDDDDDDDSSEDTLKALMAALEEAKRKVEEEKRKIKYNEKAKSKAAAKEWETAVARARAKIMAEEIIKSEKSEKEDLKVKAVKDTKQDLKKPDVPKKKEPKKSSVVLNGVTIVGEPDDSDADAADGEEPKFTIDGVAVTPESADKGPFKFYDSEEALKNGKKESTSVDPSTLTAQSKREYFANRIEETRRRASINSSNSKRKADESAKPESSKSSVAVDQEDHTSRTDDPASENSDASVLAGKEYFANRVTESRKRALLANIEGALKDSSIFLRASIEHKQAKPVTKEVKAKETSKTKVFAPNRVEEQRKLALLADLLQELPELLKSAEDEDDDFEEELVETPEAVVKEPPARNGKSAPTKPKNGFEKTEVNGSAAKKKNGVQKTKAEEDAESFEGVQKIFEETANKLGTSTNGSSKPFLRTIGKSANGRNETNVDASQRRIEAD